MEDNQYIYHIYISSEEIFIQYSLNILKLISYHRSSNKITEIDQTLLSKKVIYSTSNAHAILGVVRILTANYICIVKQSQLIGLIDSSKIFLIKEVEFILLHDTNYTAEGENEQTTIMAGLKNMLQLGFYYSFTYNLTSPQQKQIRLKDQNSDIADLADEKFYWNLDLYKVFQTPEVKSITNHICVPIICGYVNMFTEKINGKPLEFILITRRSKYHAGTRYLTRGIDDEGHCANYCETEQIIKYENKTLSFVQIRGSAPIFFQQVGLTAQTEITRSIELTIKAFSMHLDDIFKNYSMLFFVNLLNKLKQGEQIITESIENQIKLKSPNSFLRYNFFDFQNNCPYDNYDKIEDFIKQIENVVTIFQFNCINDYTGKIELTQSGTIRTNCLDCLDRTNVIQTRISWLILGKMLNYLKVPTTGVFGTESFFGQSSTKIKDMFKMLWVENGDNISIQYAGTASTISTVTKTGGHGFLGLIQHGLVSVTRVYQGSFEDNFKQRCFDILLQKHISEINNDLSIKEQITQYSEQYTTYQDITLFIGSWNIGGKELNTNDSLYEWLDPSTKTSCSSPDIYIIGLQEIVELNAKSLLYYGNNNQHQYWENIIKKQLSAKIGQYVIIKTIDLIGICVIAFVKESKKELITNLDTLIIKSGLMGSLGNKGSCLLRFNIFNSCISIACSHMSAGKEYTDSRRKEMVDLLNSSFEKYSKIQFKDHDFFFIFGDLNSRLDINTDMCYSLIQEGKYSELLKYDQLIGYKCETSIMNMIDEAKIEFAPTYKYIINSNEYDRSNRTPSYCDRILFKKGSKMAPLCYHRCEYTISDHRPIYGLYKVSVGIVNKEIKNQIMKNLKPKVSQVEDINAFNQHNYFNSIININFYSQLSRKLF